MPKKVPASQTPDEPTSAPNALVQLALEGMTAIDPQNFDGWDRDTTYDWLIVNGMRVANAGRKLDEYREAIGIGLWHLRAVAGSEKAYMADQERIAKEIRVGADTLTRWRTAAQKARKMGPPSPRSKVQQETAPPPKQKVLDVVSTEVSSGETSKQERAEGGQQADGSPTSPGAHRGAAPAAEKVGEPKPAAPKPARGSTPQAGEDPAPPVPSPPSGSSLQEAVRTNVAMVATHGATVIAHNCTQAAVTDALAALRGALVLMTGGRGKAATAEASNGCAHQWKQQKGSSGNTVYVCSRCDERSFDKQRTA